MLLISLAVVPVVRADEIKQIGELFSKTELPRGVVFEIVGGDAGSLERAIERAREYSQQLREKHKNINIVILSHGLEQFSLLKERQQQHAGLHQKVGRLVKDDNIKLEVCGSFADMMGFESTGFVDFANVVDAAPAQLENYRYQGYAVIEMDLTL